MSVTNTGNYILFIIDGQKITVNLSDDKNSTDKIRLIYRLLLNQSTKTIPILFNSKDIILFNASKCSFVMIGNSDQWKDIFNDLKSEFKNSKPIKKKKMKEDKKIEERNISNKNVKVHIKQKSKEAVDANRLWEEMEIQKKDPNASDIMNKLTVY